MTAFLTFDAICVSIPIRELREGSAGALHPIAPDRRPARHWRMRDNAPEIPPG